MSYREDYYKFTHYLVPYTVFSYGRLMIYRMEKNENSFIEELKRTWAAIELEKPQLRNEYPSFGIETIQLTVEHTGIISIPEASESQEAMYIAIVFDTTDNFRYFTYEIGKGNQGRPLYFLCEWTQSQQHINYGPHPERDKKIFINNLSEQLVYDLL